MLFSKTKKLPVGLPRRQMEMVSAALDALDSIKDDPAVLDRRTYIRYNYRRTATIVREWRNEKEEGQVRLRNLSSLGASFLHGGGCKKGSPCSLTLKQLDGKTTVIQGKVVYTRTVKDGIHEAGMKFYHAIDPKDFIPYLTEKQTDKETPEKEAPPSSSPHEPSQSVEAKDT